jgi:pre-rRNA-processing protein TSR4
MAGQVSLGFAEVPLDDERHLLLSHYFPSKIGGRPAWLRPTDLPDVDSCRCPICADIMVFLLQIYAPYQGAPDDAFHRAIFLFTCKNSACHTREPPMQAPFRAWRGQLPRRNEFYASEPPDYDGSPPSDLIDERLEKTLCVVCGLTAPKRCGACKKAQYCSVDHQRDDWRAVHKYTCTGSKSRQLEPPISRAEEGLRRQQKLRLPELELVS